MRQHKEVIKLLEQICIILVDEEVIRELKATINSLKFPREYTKYQCEVLKDIVN